MDQVTDNSVRRPTSILVDLSGIPTALTPDDGPGLSILAPVTPIASSQWIESFVYEDDGILRWDIRLVEDGQPREVGNRGRPRDGVIPGFASRIAEGTVSGPVPQDRLLVMIFFGRKV